MTSVRLAMIKIINKGGELRWWPKVPLLIMRKTAQFKVEPQVHRFPPHYDVSLAVWSVLGGSGRQMKSPIGNTGPFLMQGRGKRPILKWKINSPSGNLFIDRFHLASSSSRPDNIITLLSPFGRVFIISHIKSSSSERWLISSRGNASLDQFYTGWATGWRWRWPASGRRRERHTQNDPRRLY